MVVATRRDANKAQEFLNMMSKVCPQMGIMTQQPVTFELKDDKTQTYLSLIRDKINPQVGVGKSALQSKNAVCAFQGTHKVLSFILEDSWRN